MKTNVLLIGVSILLMANGTYQLALVALGGWDHLETVDATASIRCAAPARC